MSRCVHQVLGFGCCNEAEPKSRLCQHCHKIVFGPMWKDPVLGPVLVFVVFYLAALTVMVMGG